MPSSDEVLERLEAALAAHNTTAASPLPLTICAHTATQVAHLSHALRQPGGHALLLGACGSSRRSLVRLAAVAAGLPITQVRPAATASSVSIKTD